MEKENLDILKTIEQEMDTDVHPFLKMILDNIKAIGVAVFLIVAAVAVYSGMDVYREKERAKAVSELGLLLETADPAERTQKLESFVASAPSDIRLGARLELASLYMEQNEFEKAAAVWKNVESESKDQFSVVAALAESRALMLKNDYAKAVDILVKAQKNADSAMRPMISGALAFAAEKAGQKDLAIAEYTALKEANPGGAEFLDHKIAQLKS